MKPDSDLINKIVEMLILNDEQRVIIEDDSIYYTDKAQELFDSLYDYIENKL
tara:strand:- start:162 stop:317 length:156 start_codon:yes stop_codon:yes gene_type:complete